MKRSVSTIAILSLFLFGLTGMKQYKKPAKVCKNVKPTSSFGKKSGWEWKCWANGVWQHAGHWKNGKKQGTWVYWNANGEQLRTLNFGSGGPSLPVKAGKKDAWSLLFQKKIKGTSNDLAMNTLKQFIRKKKIDIKSKAWKTKLPKPPKATFDPNRRYYWVLNTSEGVIKILFYHKIAPMHVSSAAYLTMLGFYDGIKFHRVIKNFMAQAGCPYGRGHGDPGYKYNGEYHKAYTHTGPGILSAANTGQPGTDGSQFFITFRTTTWLNMRHTVYGKVVSGMSAVRSLERKAHLSRKGVLFIRNAYIQIQ